MATDCNDIKVKIANAIAALKTNPDDRVNQTLLNRLSQNWESDCAARNVIEAPINLICTRYSTADAAHFNQSGRDHNQRRDEVAYCNQAAAECPFKSLEFLELTSLAIDFRNTFAEILPYKNRPRTLVQVADAFLSTPALQGNAPLMALARMLKRAVVIGFSGKTEILKNLLGVYFRSVLNSDFTKLNFIFEVCGQGLQSITFLNDSTVHSEKTRPYLILFPSMHESNVYETQIKPRALEIINAVKGSTIYFKTSNFTQEELDAFVRSIGSKFQIAVGVRTLIDPTLSATYLPSDTQSTSLSRIAPSFLNVGPPNIKDLLSVDTPIKALKVRDDIKQEFSVFAQTPREETPEGETPKGETPGEETPKEETPWYKTSFGIFGICVGVVGIGGAVYVLTKKK